MEKKMFFIDLDGTTLRDDKSIPEENIQAIHEAVNQGHYVAIATGRASGSAQRMGDALQMTGKKGCFLIAYNGAKIFDLEDGKLLRNLIFPAEYAAYLFAEAEKYQLHVQAYEGQYVAARRMTPELEFYCRNTNMQSQIEEKLYDGVPCESPKVLFASLDDHEGLRKFQNDHRAWEEGKCISFFSAPEYLEYCALNGTKADGIAFFEDYLGLAHANTIAVGDEENDIAMIRMAGVGAAMLNARDTVKAEADYITERDNNHGGLAEVIRHFTA